MATRYAKFLTIVWLVSAVFWSADASAAASVPANEGTANNDRTQLLVKALDEHHKPLQLRSRKTWREMERWPSEPTVLVLPVPEHLSPFRSNEVQEAEATNDHGIAFELLAGRDYWVTLLAPGQVPQTVRMPIRTGSGQVEHTFMLYPPAVPGAILLDVLDPNNVPLTKNVSVRILDPLTGASLMATRESSRSSVLDEWPARLPLPAGEYLIEVLGAASTESHHGTLKVPRRWGDYRARVRVSPGQVTPVQARLNSPAWIQLDLQGHVTPSDRDAILSNHGWLALSVEPEDVEQRLAEFAKRARVQLWRDSGYPVVVPFTHKDVGGTTPGYLRLYGHINLGTKQKSQALAPGTFQLRVTLPGGRTFSRKVELVSGEVLELDVDLDS